MTGALPALRTFAIAAGLLLTNPARPAQAPPAPSPTLKFEVASVKRTQPGARGGGIRPAPGGERYLASNLPLKSLIAVAYGLRDEQVLGGPEWVGAEAYDMNAKAERSSSVDELHVMLQNLLAERFQLRFRREMKELPVYALVIERDAPKMTAHDPRNGGEPWIEVTEGPFLHVKWSAKYASMKYFAWRLSRSLDRPVVDLTNLNGGYDFELTFTRALPPGVSPDARLNGEAIDTSGPTIFEAVRRQLNLRLEPQKAPTETIVIEHAERPAEN